MGIGMSDKVKNIVSNHNNDNKKNVIISIGVAAVIYLIFKYIMPLAAPFIIAFLLAAGLNGQMRFLGGRLHIKRSIAAVILMVFWGGLIAGVVVLLGGLLITQINNVIDNYEKYYSYINDTMCSFCTGIDTRLGFVRGTTLAYIDSGIMCAYESAKERIMPSLMGGSIGAIKGIIAFSGIFVIFFMALYFFLKDYDRMREKALKSAYAAEYDYFYTGIGRILYTFIRTQFIIMTITMTICALGLLLLHNKYWLLLGVVLGIVDALPVFGTGTILTPWAIACVFCGKYRYAAVLVAMSFISYLVREYLEPKLMGKGLGAHPLAMLAAVYAGLVLFGVVGVITGPIAFLLIKEIAAYIKAKRNDT